MLTTAVAAAPPAEPPLAAFEAATEFFGFTPVEFVDDVVNMVNDYAVTAADHILAYLLKRKAPASVSDLEIEQVCVRARGHRRPQGPSRNADRASLF